MMLTLMTRARSKRCRKPTRRVWEEEVLRGNRRGDRAVEERKKNDEVENRRGRYRSRMRRIGEVKEGVGVGEKNEL